MNPLQERPPHVRFEIRPVENRGKSIAAGHPVYDDVEFAVITPHGGTLSVDREVCPEIVARFGEQYDAWKRNIEEPVNGSPLALWPPATPALVANCKALNMRAVEDLAAANEAVIEKLGPGARAWKEKARVWLTSAADHGKVAEEIAALKVRIEQYESTLAEKEKAIAYWKAAAEGEKPRGRPPKAAA